MNISPSSGSAPETQGAVSAAFRKAASFPALLGALLVAAVLAATSQEGSVPGSKVLADDGVWWHLAVGQRILETRTFPTSDPYSFTVKGQPWIAYEWLGEVVMASAARLGGLPGLATLLIVLSAAVMLLIYSYASLRARNSKAAFAASVLVLPITASFFTGRPQVLGYLFLLITLIALERFRQGHRRGLWWLPLLFLLWVNTHGTFVLGFVALGAYLVGGLTGFEKGFVSAKAWAPGERRQLLTVILLSALALPLTPYGSRLAAYPLEISLFQPINLGYVTEWTPLSRHNGPWGYAFVGLLVLFGLAQALLSRPLTVRLEELLLLLFAIGESLLHVRFLLFFAVVFAPLLAALLARWIPGYRPEHDKLALNAAVMALIVAAMAVEFPSCQALQEAVDKEYPIKSVEFLRQHPDLGPTFNESWGGYLLWSGVPVFLDDRFDLFEYGGVLADYIHIVHADPESPFLLRKYGVRSCLVAKNTPLHSFLAQPGWKRVYEDDVSIVFVRRGDARQDESRAARPAEPGTPHSPPN